MERRFVVRTVHNALTCYLNQWDLLTVKSGLLYKQWYEDDLDLELQLIIPPKELCQELFYHLHELRTGGHLWIKHTVYQLKEGFIGQAYKVMLTPDANGALFVRNKNLFMGGRGLLKKFAARIL